jgi:flagellar assembly protein FliH
MHQDTVQGHFELFSYPASSHAPAVPDWQGWIDPSAPQSAGQDHPDFGNQTATNADFEKRLTEETRRSFEAGSERGRQEGLQTEREEHVMAQKAADERQLRQHADLVKTFAEERDRYLHAVEKEVVKLALAVAARILRREAQMDPLLLSGAVRVALGQLSGSTEVRLRVPAGELKLWTEAIALIPNLALKPVLEAGEGMRLGDCVIETSMGSVDLGIRSQLGEIERGFFDRAGSAVAITATETLSAPESAQ